MPLAVLMAVKPQATRIGAVTTKKDGKQAGDLTRRLVDAVEHGGPGGRHAAGRRLLRRLEGAIAAWQVEASAGAIADRPPRELRSEATIGL